MCVFRSVDDVHVPDSYDHILPTGWALTFPNGVFICLSTHPDNNSDLSALSWMDYYSQGALPLRFPPSAHVLMPARQLLGDHLHIPGFYIVHDVLTIAMCLTWLVLVICTSIAFMHHEIFFEQDPLPSRYVFA